MSSSEITRSMEAPTPVMAGVVDRARKSPPSGWWGVAIFIGGETTFFALMIASYFYLRFQNTHWPPPGIEKPKVLLPLVLTAILISTTIPLFMAVRSARRGRVAAALMLVALALLIQGGYLGIQISEFLSDAAKVDPKGHSYGSIYLTLLFAHHFHVAVGMLLELWLISRLVKGLTNYRLTALRCTALYWYFVAAVGVAVVFTEIYPSL